MCRRDLFSLCENSNPNAWIAGKLMGHSPAGLFGFAVYAYREAILACRGGGTVSVIGVYGGFIEPHPLRLEDAPRGYEMFLHKRDHCEKVVLST